MLTAETKRHIDSARQVLVGKVPDPKSQIEQITNALIYKFMDDMDEQAAALGGKRKYFTGDYEKYSWRKLMLESLGAHERLILYRDAIERMANNTNLPKLFQSIFRNVYLPYNDARTLTMFLQEIDYFDYKHSEELGNAYEYLLSIMGSQGDAGQFRTPRHIIDFIVQAVNPDKNDSVLDPACGTAGFLISAYKHVIEKHDGKNNETGEVSQNEPRLTRDEIEKIYRNYHGFDIDDNMVKMAKVNMYLHNFPDPNIVVHDSLSSEDYWNEKYDVILANPPFMTPKGGIVPHGKFGVVSNRAEVLFVDYIKNHLKPNGRAGIIVPEGIIFQSGSAYKQLRKSLIEDGLYAVVSLPSGVFAPYSGVKTSVLLFNNNLSKINAELLFLKVDSDGFDLGAQRRVSVKNDLPIALEILSKWNNSEKVENKLATYVEKSIIAKSGDYNLSGDRYRKATDYTNARWPMVELGEICDLQSGSRQKGGAVDSGVYSIGGEQISEDNLIRFEKMKYITESHFLEMRKGVLAIGDVLMVKDGATTGKMGYWNYDYRAAVNEHVYIFRAKDQIIPRYLYNVLYSDSFQYELKPYIKGIIGGISLEIKKIQIPLPPLEIQEQIVTELDGYAGIIAGAKQIVQNWKPKIEVDLKWEKVKLGEVCEKLFAGGDVPKDNYSLEKSEKHQVPIYTNGINEKSLYGFTNVVRVEKESVTISARGTIGYSEVRMAPFYPAVRLIVATPDINKIDVRFLKYSIDALVIYRNGNSIPQLTIPMISNEIIPLPSLAIQKQIVEKIESERSLVESAKKLINIYEQKTKDVIAKLWEE